MNRHFLLIVLILMALATLPELSAQQPRKTPAKKPATTAKQPPPKQAEPPIQEDLKRLILKDGSYQGVVKYQIFGDRVHFLSSERYDWEDIPSSLIDWDASRKYTAEFEQSSKRAREVDAEAEKERAEQEANTPTVSPGITLPATGGVWLLDVYQDKPALSELVQNGAEVNKNTKINILRSAINPLAGSKQTVVLSGAHAHIQAHVGNPFIYIALDDDTPHDIEFQKTHWRIVKLEEKKGTRIVGDVNIAFYGKVKQKAYYVNADVTPVSGPWIKVVPAQMLLPGEYALVEMMGDQGINRFVWDFGVNPNAPENPGAWKAVPVKANAGQAEKAPSLDQRQQ